MKVIIDTNVLVSAVLRGRNPEAVILFAVEHPDVDWIASQEILNEYKEVLSRDKFGLPKNLLQRWFHLIDAFTTVIEVDLTLDFPRDPKDAMFLECALTAEADFFITGDRDFDEAQKLINTTILSVSMFKKLIIDTAN